MRLRIAATVMEATAVSVALAVMAVDMVVVMSNEKRIKQGADMVTR